MKIDKFSTIRGELLKKEKEIEFLTGLNCMFKDTS